jgi:carbon monoxide dehydrogenase subunit G
LHCFFYYYSGFPGGNLLFTHNKYGTKRGLKMRKIFKIILVVFAVLIIGVVSFGAIIFLDVAAYTATGSKTLTPAETSVGKALVIYDPGLSGTAKGVADKVASDLQVKGYIVTLAGIKSSAAASAVGYRVIVVGGPVYAGSLTSSVKGTLSNLTPDQGAKIGIYGSGQGATTTDDVTQIKQSIPSGSDTSLSGAVVVKIGEKEDLNTRAQGFVDQLVS